MVVIAKSVPKTFASTFLASWPIKRLMLGFSRVASASEVDGHWSIDDRLSEMNLKCTHSSHVSRPWSASDPFLVAVHNVELAVFRFCGRGLDVSNIRASTWLCYAQAETRLPTEETRQPLAFLLFCAMMYDLIAVSDRLIGIE